MIAGLTILLVCQALGETLVHLFHLSIPAPVLGMALLFGLLTVRGRVPDGLDQASRGLLGSLSMLFVPAGVGIIAYWPLLRAQWPALTLGLVGGTIATLLVTGWIFQTLLRRDPS